MHQSQQNDPLHGMSLQKILEYLVTHLGWEQLGQQIRINCFLKDPSVKSSLKFLRKTPWARSKVEQLYVQQIAGSSVKKSANAKPKAATPENLESGTDFVWPEIKK
jgi:uncharacterized protein (DUF2132 family)